MKQPWICCQLGAREHYAIPRSLHQAQQLHSLCTDTWVTPSSLLSKIPLRSLKPLYDRYHPDLGNATIHHLTPQALLFEAQHKARNTTGWNLIIKRNDWFQQQTLPYLKSLRTENLNTDPILFSYSYTALELFRYAKSQGWKTILGQIDPGIVESKLVQEESDRHPELAPNYQAPPALYWEQWLEECRLADQIVVNSQWSSHLLQQAGVEPHKIQIVPLVYTPPPEALGFERSYPDAFSDDRPLRILFLGQVILRKGIAAIIEAAKLLIDRPIEFWIVGSLGIQPPFVSNIHWLGPVPRSQVANYYRNADLFLFPTLSDGFGLTQLEAQAWKLPIIASDRCGNVVTSGINGLILDNIRGSKIASTLDGFLNDTQLLKAFACQTTLISTQFSLKSLCKSLLHVAST